MKHPLLKYHGGKFKLSKWIQEHQPSNYTHRNYPFGGGLGELWTWDCDGISECVNDIDKELSNFWRVLADPELSLEFIDRVSNIPFSEVAWNDALAEADDFVCSAVNFFVVSRQSRQGLRNEFSTPTSRIRGGMNEGVSAWLSTIERLPEVHQRLIRVEIRDLDFRKFIPRYDHEDALFYCDPTYLKETRAAKASYRYELSDMDHYEMLVILSAIEGKFMLSAYQSKMYEDFARIYGWDRKDLEVTLSSSNKSTKPKKVESLYLNY